MPGDIRAFFGGGKTTKKKDTDKDREIEKDKKETEKAKAKGKGKGKEKEKEKEKEKGKDGGKVRSSTENRSNMINTNPPKSALLNDRVKKERGKETEKRKREKGNGKGEGKEEDDDEEEGYDVESSEDENELDDDAFMAKLEKEINKKNNSNNNKNKRRKVETGKEGEQGKPMDSSTYFSSGTTSKYFDASFDFPSTTSTSASKSASNSASTSISASMVAGMKKEKQDKKDKEDKRGREKEEEKGVDLDSFDMEENEEDEEEKQVQQQSLPVGNTNNASSIYDATTSSAEYDGNFKKPTGKNRYIEVGPASNMKMPINRPMNFSDFGLKAHGPNRSGESTKSSSSSSSSSSFSPRKKNDNKLHQKQTQKIKKDGPHQENELWSDKYKPMVPSDLVGSTEIVNKLTRWLSMWDDLHRHKVGWNKINARGKENEGAKAALLSGPPGIGKSSCARIVANYLGYTVFELNASDTRNKKSLEGELKDVLGNTAMRSSSDVSSFGFGIGNKNNQTFSSSFSSSKVKGEEEEQVDFSKNVTQKRIIIMDEVDGMSGSDRGGMQELIKLIKTSKVPIITICNDRQSTKVRSLANYCLDLRFKRPAKNQVMKRMMDICQREGLDIDSEAILRLVESCGNDIRQILNTLQMMNVRGKGKENLNSSNTTTNNNINVTQEHMLAKLRTIEKDKSLRLSPFEAATQMINGAPRPRSNEEDNLSLQERYNYFFVDYSLIPLLMEQSYIDSIRNDSRIRGSEKIARLEEASSFVSDMDLVSSKIIGGDQHWELLPLHAMLTVAVGNAVKGWIGYPTFPQWLGKNSSRNKKKRMLSELTLHLHGEKKVSGTSDGIRFDYFPVLRDRVINMLQEQDVDGLITFLDEYGLSKDDVFETFPELYLSEVKGADGIKDSLDTKLKTSITREYNKRAHKSQVLAEAMQFGGRKKGKAGSSKVKEEEEEGEGGLEEEQQQEEEAEEEEDLEAVRAMFANKKRGGGGKTAASTGKGKEKEKEKEKGKGKGKGKGTKGKKK